jgi:hypothetical protein
MSYTIHSVVFLEKGRGMDTRNFLKKKDSERFVKEATRKGSKVIGVITKRGL